MSRPVCGLTIKDFYLILKFAQEKHAELDEPIPDLGKDNEARITTCLNNPFQTFGGKQLYKGFYRKAAILFYSIIKGHALVNGNKRMAILCMIYFCLINDKKNRFTDESLYTFAKDIAKSQNPEKALIKTRAFFRAHITTSDINMLERTKFLSRRVRFYNKYETNVFLKAVYRSKYRWRNTSLE